MGVWQITQISVSYFALEKEGNKSFLSFLFPFLSFLLFHHFVIFILVLFFVLFSFILFIYLFFFSIIFFWPMQIFYLYFLRNFIVLYLSIEILKPWLMVHENVEADRLGIIFLTSSIMVWLPIPEALYKLNKMKNWIKKIKKIK